MFRMRSKRWVSALLAAELLIGSSLLMGPQATHAAAPDYILINEVSGGGGKINNDDVNNPQAAPYLYDFIELYNPTGTDIPLTGYTLNYSNKGATTNQSYSFEPGAVIKANDYFLVRNEATWGNEADKNYGEPFYSDAYGDAKEQGIGMSDTDGSVQLLNAQDAVIDTVGFGAVTTSFHEGNTVNNGVSLPKAVSAVRRNSFTDTNNNSNDFSIVSPSPTKAGNTEGQVELVQDFVKRINHLQSDASWAGKTVTIEGLITTPPVQSADGQASPVRYVQSYTGGIAVEGMDANLVVGTEVRVTGTVGTVEGEIRVIGTPVVDVLSSKEFKLDVADTFDKNMLVVANAAAITPAYWGTRVSSSAKVASVNAGNHTMVMDNGITLYINGTLPAAQAGDHVTALGTVAKTGSEVRLAVADPSKDITISPASSAIQDQFAINKLATYKVGATNKDGGVAEIVKYNSDNKKFYLVNGSSNPPSLDIVSLGDGTKDPVKDATILVQALAEKNGFIYGDLTSVDVNTASDRIVVSVQEKDAAKKGKILVLDYDGRLLTEYEAGVQPDMIKFTTDGRYILTANEGEPRDGAVDPEGSVTIVDTKMGTVHQVKFDDPSVIDDSVHIRGASDPVTGMITGKGTKGDAVRDLEPEYITLSADNSKAYVSLQENNSIAVIDIAQHKVTSVKGLGYKSWNTSGNTLDLLKDNAIKLENVPFKGIYMPDGIASQTIGGATYLFTANEGDVTEWTGRENGSKIGEMKGLLAAGSEAAAYLGGKTIYDDVEVATEFGHDSIYMYGARSFSIWQADTMNQVYDSGSDFEKITSQRLPNNFNTSNSKTAMDDRSAKKGPEPEDIKVAKVGNKTLAFIGLERIGGIMTYDVSNPASPVFVNYTNSRVFTPKDNLLTDTGPEGIEFIPATISPTGRPLLLVANEVGGTVAMYELSVSKVTLDKLDAALQVGGAQKITAQVEPAGGSVDTVTWSSSHPYVASVDANGNITGVGAGQAVISAISADGYGLAQVNVSVTGSQGGGIIIPAPPVEEKEQVTITKDDKSATAKLSLTKTGTSEAIVTEEQLAEALKQLNSAVGAQDLSTKLVIEAAGNDNELSITLPAASLKKLTESGLEELTVETSSSRVTLDQQALSATVSASGTSDNVVRIQMERTAEEGSSDQAYELIISAGGKEVSSLNGGVVSVALPYTPGPAENLNTIVVAYMDSNNLRKIIGNGYYNESTGMVEFTATELTMFTIGNQPVNFQDIEGSYAEEHIHYLAAREVIQGTKPGQYSPKALITRGDFTILLARIAGADLNGHASSESFTDVQDNDYYAGAIAWAAANGIVNGTGDGKFEPEASLTRAELVTLIERFSRLMKQPLVKNADEVIFTDQEFVPGYAKEAVASAQEAGLISGRPDGAGGYEFAPGETATREQAAKILAKLVQAMNW
ncbi:choice-of-anchor I family protein [Paenibacillus sp. GCM10023252]|uniref:choice-of-anchor I family protein n=1 Tax=Paenibacillus sp. GCM10023252 TaxID=3252649 RepID=UPI0036157723